MNPAPPTLPEYDRIADLVRAAWVRLNAATDTYDAHRALKDLETAWEKLAMAEAELLARTGESVPAEEMPDRVAARHHAGLRAGPAEAAAAVRALLAQVADVETRPGRRVERIDDARVVHDAIPVLWRIIRGLRQELRRIRPRAYYSRAARQTAGALAAAALAWAVIRAAGFVTPSGCRVTYYRGENFEDVRGWQAVSELAGAWGGRRPLPTVPRTHWSARWRGVLDVPATGDYAFFGQSDDGLRLWIDDDLVIDNWREQKWRGSGRHATRHLAAGRHTIRMEFFHRAGEAAVRVRWTGGPIPPDTVIGAPYLKKY